MDEYIFNISIENFTAEACKISDLLKSCCTSSIYYSLLSIFHINILQIGTFVFKVKYKFTDLPYTFGCYFVQNSKFHNHSTRQAEHLHLPLYKSSSSRFSIKYRGVFLWNENIHLLDSSVTLCTKRIWNSMQKQLVWKNNLVHILKRDSLLV